MPHSHRNGDTILADILEAFELGDFDAGLEIYDNHRHISVNTLAFIARGVSDKYPQEAIYMLHDLIWETTGNITRFRMHGDRPTAYPGLVSSYLWAQILFERLDEEYAYPTTIPPAQAYVVFDSYLKISPGASRDHRFVTDGLRAHFESIVQDASIEREYNLDAVKDALEIIKDFRGSDGKEGKMYRRPGEEFELVPYKQNDRFLMWEACLYALIYDSKDATRKEKVVALRETKRALGEFFDVSEAGHNKNSPHPRFPNISREVGSLVYFLGDEKLIERLNRLYDIPTHLPSTAHGRWERDASDILDRMKIAADNWPFVRIEAHGEAAHVAEDEATQSIDIGPRAFAEDNRRPVRRAADEVGPRRDTAQAAPQLAREPEARHERAASEPRQPRAGRGSVQRMEIVGKKGRTQTVIVERKPRRTPTTGQPRRGKDGNNPKR